MEVRLEERGEMSYDSSRNVTSVRKGCVAKRLNHVTAVLSNRL
jgi:hypothetical protein